MKNMKKWLLFTLIANLANAASVDSNGQWNFSANENASLLTATTVNSTTNGIDLNAPGLFSNHYLELENWIVNANNNGISLVASNGYPIPLSPVQGNLNFFNGEIKSKTGVYARDVYYINLENVKVDAQNVGVDLVEGQLNLRNVNLTSGDTGVSATFTRTKFTPDSSGYASLFDSVINAQNIGFKLSYGNSQVNNSTITAGNIGIQGVFSESLFVDYIKEGFSIENSTITAPIAIDIRNVNEFTEMDFLFNNTINGDVLASSDKLNYFQFNGGAGKTQFNGKVENISLITGGFDNRFGIPGDYIISANDIYLSPNINNDFGVSQLLDPSNVAGATFSGGSLVFEGNMKIGVNYDGITSVGTSNTGKIVFSSFKNNGTISLVKSTDTRTSRSIIGELFSNDPLASRTSINNIIITENKVSINPFSLDSNLTPESGWTTLTTSDRVRSDGYYAVDQVYTRIGGVVGVGVAGNRISLFIPRSRVNLDNAENHKQTFNETISTNEKRFVDVKYIGQLSGKFDETKKNYGYKNKGNGIVVTAGNSITDKLSGVASLQYINSSVNYKDTSKEKIDSFSLAGGLNYNINNIDLGLFSLVERNNHNKKINMVNNSDNESKFTSTVGILSLNGKYNYKFGNGLQLTPKLELGLLTLHESKEEYGKVVVSEISKSSGFVKPSINISKSYGKLNISTGIEYNLYLGNNLHDSKLIENTNGLLEVPRLEYGNGTLGLNVGLDYKITNNLSVNASYEYLKNKGFKNNNATLGVSYIF